jgi:hypothetical protein
VAHMTTTSTLLALAREFGDGKLDVDTYLTKVDALTKVGALAQPHQSGDTEANERVRRALNLVRAL